MWGGGGGLSRSYAVSAPVDQDASQLYYSCCIISGVGGGGGGCRGVDELWVEFLVVVIQCLLLLTDPSQLDYSCLIISGSRWRGGGRGGGGVGELVCSTSIHHGGRAE